MSVNKPQNLNVQGATVVRAKSVSILSARNKVVRGFATKLACKAPVRKGAKSSCNVNLTLTRKVPLGKYTLNLLDAKRQVLATGQFEVEAGPQARRKTVRKAVVPLSRAMSPRDRAVGLATQDSQGIAAPDPLRQVTAPDGTPVIVGNPNPMISISSFTTRADVASGKRQARISFSTKNANPTHYRAVSVNSLNSNTPFSGVGWRSYTGAAPVVELLECGLSSMDNYRIALQVKGPDVPKPSFPSQTIANISSIAYATLSVLPESLQSRISSVQRFPGAGAQGSSPVQMRGDVARTGGLVRLGNQTVGEVASFLLEIKNHPGGLNPNLLKSVNRNCFVVTAVGNVTNEPGGTTKVVIDGRFDFTKGSCQPRVVVGQCGASDERFHARDFPLRFDKVTTVYTNTNDIADRVTLVQSQNKTGCQGIVNNGGDLSFSTESQGPVPMGCSAGLRINFDDGYSEQWALHFKSSGSGQCGLGETFFNTVTSGILSAFPTYQALRAALATRRSDYNWAYDDVSSRPIEVQPRNLNMGLRSNGGRYFFMHSCGVRGGSIRTWIDKAVHTRFISEPVRRVR